MVSLAVIDCTRRKKKMSENNTPPPTNFQEAFGNLEPAHLEAAARPNITEEARNEVAHIRADQRAADRRRRSADPALLVRPPPGHGVLPNAREPNYLTMLAAAIPAGPPPPPQQPAAIPAGPPPPLQQPPRQLPLLDVKLTHVNLMRLSQVKLIQLSQIRLTQPHRLTQLEKSRTRLTQ